MPSALDGGMQRRLTRMGDYRVHSVHAGAGAPVVLLHGLSGSHHWWRFTLPALAERYRVHIPELVGFGRSRAVGVQPDVPAMAALLAEWIESQEIERAHLIGHSMGGQLAIHLAAERPERVDRLVLVGAAGIPRDLSLPVAVRLLAEIVPPRAWGRFGFLPTIALDALRAGPRVLLSATRHLLSDDVRPLLPRIASPTLLVWGEYDALVPLEHGRFMAERIPGARLLVLGDAAHVPMADRPDDFNRAVRTFLDER